MLTRMLNGKWLLVIGLIAASIGAYLYWGVRLGLDLKGGIHLVLRVETDDALRAELDDAVKSVRSRLDEKQVPYGSVERELDASLSRHRLLVKGLTGDASERAHKIVERALPGYTLEVTGAQITASIPPARVTEIRSSTVEQALTTIGERVNATGVVEPTIQRQGTEEILVQLPGIADPEHVKALIGRVASLELKLVASGPHHGRDEALAAHQNNLPATLEVLEGTDEEGALVYYVVENVAVVNGRDLRSASPQKDELNQPSVGFKLNPEGAKKFGDATGKNIGKQLAVVLDGRVKNAPVIRSRISDSGQISGGFTAEEARSLALVLRAGALPAKIQYLQESSVGPSLGKESIKKGFYSGLAGLIAIIVVMVFYYRKSGLNAVVALILNAVYLFGALAMLRATLTLPGIAGAILTLGMAVDANVLIFESIRESLRAGTAPNRAIEDGFSKAFSTIVDTHLTTILAALALWMLGSGPVRGFGVTLLIGLLISMFTAYFVSKTIFETFVLGRQWKPGETLSI